MDLLKAIFEAEGFSGFLLKIFAIAWIIAVCITAAPLIPVAIVLGIIIMIAKKIME